MAMSPVAKKILLAPVRFLDSLLDRSVSLAGAFVLCQFPHFKILYLQRLGGHVDELSRIVKAYAIAAQSAGLSLEKFIAKHLSSNVQEFNASGRIMSENVDRLKDLSEGLKAIKGASPEFSLLEFLRHINLDIARETMKTFTPGLPLTIEGLVYAGIGLVLAMVVYWIIKKALQGLLSVIFVKRRKSA